MASLMVEASVILRTVKKWMGPTTNREDAIVVRSPDLLGRDARYRFEITNVWHHSVHAAPPARPLGKHPFEAEPVGPIEFRGSDICDAN
jgi:hypothetical protein